MNIIINIQQSKRSCDIHDQEVGQCSAIARRSARTDVNWHQLHAIALIEEYKQCYLWHTGLWRRMQRAIGEEVTIAAMPEQADMRLVNLKEMTIKVF